ncbi:MAG: glycerol-3-phosphate dehydrogenase C-terminal domain-containing protein, partial [Aliihoeflea sp.]
QEATRDYVLKADNDGAPLVNIFGGKITTYRRLAESMLEKIGGLIGKKGKPWTVDGTLPGGDFAVGTFGEEIRRLHSDYAFLDEKMARRLIRLYGTRARQLLGNATSFGDLGQHFGADLYEAEVRYLVAHEWAMSAEDVLWRRTKRGLVLSTEEAAALDGFMRDIAKAA